MEDQLLRAKNTGNDMLSNPNAYRFRRSYGGTYYQYRVRLLLHVLWCLANLQLQSFLA